MKIPFISKKRQSEDVEMSPSFKNVIWIGLAQALGAFAYVALVSFFLAVAGSILGYLSPLVVQITMLLIIILSALALALIFLSYPLFLFSRGQHRMAHSAVFYSFLWFLFLIAVFLVIMSSFAPKPF